jgi:uncharacterized membrane protein
MSSIDDVTIARAIHVVAVVHWMGGVAFVTTVILPAVSTMADASQRLPLFETIERRFSTQVRVSVPLAGMSGAYMAERLDLWARFLLPESWWLMAMAVVWIVFMVILFLLEPLVVRHRLRETAAPDQTATLRLMRRVHLGLATAGAVTAAAAVLGAHGSLG